MKSVIFGPLTRATRVRSCFSSLQIEKRNNRAARNFQKDCGVHNLTQGTPRLRRRNCYYSCKYCYRNYEHLEGIPVENTHHKKLKKVSNQRHRRRLYHRFDKILQETSVFNQLHGPAIVPILTVSEKGNDSQITIHSSHNKPTRN